MRSLRARPVTEGTRSVRFSPAAQADIEDIWDFTSKHWGREQAVRYIRNIEATSAGIADGRVHVRSAEDIRQGYKKAACGAHMIYFLESADGIAIIRILHQSMDADRHL